MPVDVALSHSFGTPLVTRTPIPVNRVRCDSPAGQRSRGTSAGQGPSHALRKVMRATTGDGSAYHYAAIYTQWCDRAGALESLDTAMRLRD
jgi:hypothetical protein